MYPAAKPMTAPRIGPMTLTGFRVRRFVRIVPEWVMRNVKSWGGGGS